DGGVTAVNDYANLLTAVRQDMTVLTNYQAVESMLDVDDFIDYMIVTYYAGNWDWGSDNWYASHNRADLTAKWHFHSWDQEHSFQTDDNGDEFNVNWDTTNKNDFGGPTEIQQRLMLSPEYKIKFADHVQKLLYNGGLLTPASVQA